MTHRSMVFGDDGSMSADLAWLWINSHRWPQWRVEIVTAVMPAYVRACGERGDLHRWEPDNPRRPFVEAQIEDAVHLTGDLDPRLALSRSADLLVIGARGPGLAKAMHLGSTAEWLMTHPPAPMVVVRHGRPSRTAVICHDGSPHARSATDTVCALPWVDQLSVTLVVVDDGRTDVEWAVDSASRSLVSVGADVHQTILHGEPTHQLLHYLEQNTPDLLVLGTRGLTGIKRFRVGSTAGVLAHTTRGSVLLACDDSADFDQAGVEVETRPDQTR